MDLHTGGATQSQQPRKRSSKTNPAFDSPSPERPQTLEEFLAENCDAHSRSTTIAHYNWLFHLKVNSLVYVGGCYWVNTGVFLVKVLSDYYVQLHDGRVFHRTGIEAGSRIEPNEDGWIDNPALYQERIDALLLRLGLSFVPAKTS